MEKVLFVLAGLGLALLIGGNSLGIVPFGAGIIMLYKN